MKEFTDCRVLDWRLKRKLRKKNKLNCDGDKKG